jgi:methylmalonyl-CoA/ethylmalonyl-CoA epimerase
MKRMIKKLDHIALAVKDTDEVVASMSKLFGFEVTELHEEAAAGFKSTMISTGEISLELIQPSAPDSMIQKFIEKRGGGLHHISVQVDDLDAEMSRLKGLGAQFVTEEPALVNGCRVIFIHPRSANGLLIELNQRN